MTRKAIPGFEGLYEADDAGEIWRVGRRKLVPSLVYGYPRVTLSKRNVKTNHFVHVLVLTTFVGPCPDGMESRHRDGARTNAALSNLHWGTAQQNADDRQTHGTVARGEGHGMVKLTEAQVREIKASRHEKVKDLAWRFEVSSPTIEAIRYGRLWRHIQ